MKVLLVKVVAVCLLYLWLSGAALAHLEKCEGLGYIRPHQGGLGTIYLTFEPVGKRFKRLGYLPAGSVVNLQPPHPSTSQKFKDNHCRFSLGTILRGHVDRSDVHSLQQVLIDLNLNVDDVKYLLAPAHPDVERPLQIFESSALEEELHAFSRSQDGLALVLAGDHDDVRDALEVRFVRGGQPLSAANLETGFVDVASDRDLHLDGTFRLHPLEATNSIQPDANDADNDSWHARFLSYVRGLAKQGGEAIEVETAQEALLKLAGCKREGKVTLEVRANGGFDVGFFGASIAGATKLALSIDSDEVIQFEHLGDDSQVQLSISGLTKCNGRQPYYLQEADIRILAETEGFDDISFSFVRSEFYDSLEGQSHLEADKLDRRSRLSNIAGNIHPVMVVGYLSSPRKHYWAYFDALERFLNTNVFDVVEVPREMRFPIVLLTMEALSHWRSSTG